ncbi:MAG TPA: aldehyde dehydrogenase family protein, partial [Longimicrobiaceae bacterium]|nr:aldehyde dehydrogenase family protein [Longimicrobiaceae bacterium]
MTIQSINPATGELLHRYESLGEAALDEKLARAAECYREYRRTRYGQRAGWLARAGEILEAEKDELGRLMTREMGKPLRAAVAEAEKCAWV